MNCLPPAQPCTWDTLDSKVRGRASLPASRFAAPQLRLGRSLALPMNWFVARGCTRCKIAERRWGIGSPVLDGLRTLQLNLPKVRYVIMRDRSEERRVGKECRS